MDFSCCLDQSLGDRIAANLARFDVRESTVGVTDAAVGTNFILTVPPDLENLRLLVGTTVVLAWGRDPAVLPETNPIPTRIELAPYAIPTP